MAEQSDKEITMASEKTNQSPDIGANLWAEVEHWFHQLADLPTEEQELELTRLKETKPETYRWLKTLLAEDSDTHPLLSQSAQTILNDWQQDAAMAGTTIGAFLLRQHLGHGAMGSVFLAERNDGQFDQKVALKLMKPVIHDETLQNFFRKERQILATLSHPHIARLYDGGFTDKGRPYFTMEYISGLPLDEYCFRHNLPLAQRLNIFLQVCDAVSYAHRSLVVHLDLKPGNIIVDNEGTVKLLDFGVSSLLTQHAVEEADMSPPNRFTLAYAAPEQLTSSQVSTSSDIYALGTILYELLAGCHPFQSDFADSVTLKHSILHSTPGHLRETARTPAGLPAHLLNEDLDAICQKAMRKTESARYEFVEALTNDIQAYLSGYPLKARKNTAGYVVGKFIARNRKMVAAVAISLALLAAVVVYYTIRLSIQRDIARQEATRASEITHLLTDVFTAADPNVGGGDTLTAVQLLDQGLYKLDANLKDQPELLASMLSQISPIYLNLGQYAKSDSLARLALAINRDLFKPPHETLAANLLQLGQVMIVVGEMDSAGTLVSQALEQYRMLGMTDEPEMADALIELSSIYYNKGQYLESDSIYRIAYTIHLEEFKPPHAELASDLHVIGTTLRKLGEYKQAEEYLLRSLAMKRKLYNEPNLEIAYTLNHLGSLKQNTDDWRGSISYIRKSLEQRSAILGPIHIETLASQSNLARAYSNLGILDSAVVLYEDALSKMRTIFSDGHYYIGAITQSLAQVYLRKNDLIQAETLFRESIRLQEETLPEDDVNRAFSLMGLGNTLMKKGDHKSSEKLLKQALDLRASYLPEGHELVALSQQALGECSLAMKNYTTTIVLLESAYSSLQKFPDKYKEELGHILRELADACERSNLPDKAAHYQELIAGMP